MLKSYNILLLSLILTLSTQAPAVLSVISDKYSAVLVECNYEDFEEKEIFDNVNGQEKSIRLFYASQCFDNSVVLNTIISTTVYIDRLPVPELEIQLPPPEKI